MMDGKEHSEADAARNNVLPGRVPDEPASRTVREFLRIQTLLKCQIWHEGTL